MDQHQNPANLRMVNSQADLRGAIPVEAAFDDLQHSNFMYDHQMPVETAMNDFQIDSRMEQLSTNIRGAYNFSTTSDSAAADAAFFLYSSVNPTGAVWPKQKNHHYNNHAWLFTNGDCPVWNENYAFKPGREVKGKATNAIRATTRSSEAQDHIMAERNRREKLNQRFIALSSLIPGLKKMDKATVLEDATKYVKQLQEQIKTLEKQTKSRTMIESTVVVKKTLLLINDNNMSGFSNNETSFIERTLPDESLPEIDVRFCDNKVFIGVHCDRKKGAVEKIMSEIVKLHMTIVNSNILTFGSSALDVTVLAQMNQEGSMAEKEQLVKTLCIALKSFI